MTNSIKIDVSSKVNAMIGFAIRSGKIVYGLDRIEARGRKYVLIMDKDAGNNTAKAVHRISRENGIPLFLSREPLEGIVHKTNCKVIALTDKNMAMGVLNSLQNNGTESDSADFIEVK